MVLGPRMLFQIKLELILIGVESLIVYMKGDTKSLNPGCFAIGNQCVCETLFFNGGRELLRFIRADGNDLIAYPGELCFDFSQLSQLRIAIRSPSAAVKDE